MIDSTKENEAETFIVFVLNFQWVLKIYAKAKILKICPHFRKLLSIKIFPHNLRSKVKQKRRIRIRQVRNEKKKREENMKIKVKIG